MLLAVCCLSVCPTEIQAQTAPVASVPTPVERYLVNVGLPAQAIGFWNALPGIFDQAGHERRILGGTIAIGGQSIPFLFTRELDQKVRLDLGGAAPRSLIVTGLNTLATAVVQSVGTGAEATDNDILEVLTDDPPEGLFFSFGTAARIRWLGGSYRTDGGTDTAYSGPYYDIYARTAATGTQPESPERTKVFLFDSKSKLLGITRYQIVRGGATVEAEVAWGGWTSLNGQMVPASIVRSEGGQTAFTITITAASSVATQADSSFNP
jgi:hypothetical protein